VCDRIHKKRQAWGFTLATEFECSEQSFMFAMEGTKKMQTFMFVLEGTKALKNFRDATTDKDGAEFRRDDKRPFASREEAQGLTSSQQ
jgi:hypothetical protein